MAEKSVYVLERLFGKILLERIFGDLFFISDFFIIIMIIN
jgi:hypothetical protein